MALSRRTGQRFQAQIWPGFVDAMTGLLLVLMFVLTIFMVLQYVLRETITGQENRLGALSAELSALAQQLGLAEDRNRELETEVGTLRSTLSDAQAEAETNALLIASLIGERNEAREALVAYEAQITAFEAQVAALIAQRDEANLTIEHMNEFQPHQVKKKYAVWARYEGLRAEGCTVPETNRLRIKQLADELGPEFNARQTAGTRQRVRQGKTAEPTPKAAE